ncbi:MAG: helicase-related protein, partial [Anaerotardibacter sp.]
TNGYQAAMMGPTEILVNQYVESVGKYLSKLGITWALLTGSTPSSEKQAIIERLQEGTCQVVFGTHALLEPGVQFKNCSFLCIDEQQRFGVEQRKTFVDRAPGADILSLTATPIPRSLALAIYGDLSISYIRSVPSQRGKRSTKVCHFSEQSIAYDAVFDALERGEQAYVVCPLIGISTKKLDSLTPSFTSNQREDLLLEESEGENEGSEVEYAAIEFGLENETLQPEVSSAIKHAEMLQNTVFSQACVGLLHGKLSHEEKEETMREFREGKIDVLVSTTVVEVGVDVPNATVMIVEDADRFGLAQLHQLRGRVGRGTKDAQVFLVSRSQTPEALERLGIMEQTEDGFEVSEYDLAERREGDIFGLNQHGVSKLKLVNVIRDKAIIEAARKDAEDILYNQTISDEEYRILRYELDLFMKEKG